MDFRQSSQYARELTHIIGYYAEVDFQSAKRFFQALERMEFHLKIFPEAAPLTLEPPIRKFILKNFPIRIRYSIEKTTSYSSLSNT